MSTDNRMSCREYRPAEGGVKMKTKNIRVPVELVDAIKERDNSRPPGEVLYDMYKQYLVMEGFAKKICELQGWQYKNDPSGVISEYLTKLSEQNKQQIKRLEQLSTMVNGLDMFFNRFSRKKPAYHGEVEARFFLLELKDKQEELIDAKHPTKNDYISNFIEAVGDIYRELCKEQPDPAYIKEKLNRLENIHELTEGDIKELETAQRDPEYKQELKNYLEKVFKLRMLTTEFDYRDYYERKVPLLSALDVIVSIVQWALDELPKSGVVAEITYLKTVLVKIAKLMAHTMTAEKMHEIIEGRDAKKDEMNTDMIEVPESYEDYTFGDWEGFIKSTEDIDDLYEMYEYISLSKKLTEYEEETLQNMVLTRIEELKKSL